MLFTMLQEAEHGFEVAEAARQLGQFLAWFGIFGPLGFRFVVMRGGGGSLAQPDRELAAVDQMRAAALKGAATIGMGGALLLIVDLLPWTGRTAVALVCAAVLALAYAVALRGSQGAWTLALLAGLVLTFRNVVTLRWTTLVNPVHMTCAALWIGTLFVIVSAGLPAVLRAPLGPLRGPLVRELITRFSPLALFSSGLLVLTGVLTAWRHLGAVNELWNSSYGYALMVKLCFVAGVAALGAWNWRRMSPRLGTDEAAHAIRRSATGEVLVALAVLLVTAVLVSLPAPAEQRQQREQEKSVAAPGVGPAGAVRARPAGVHDDDD